MAERATAQRPDQGVVRQPIAVAVRIRIRSNRNTAMRGHVPAFARRTYRASRVRAKIRSLSAAANRRPPNSLVRTRLRCNAKMKSMDMLMEQRAHGIHFGDAAAYSIDSHTIHLTHTLLLCLHRELKYNILACQATVDRRERIELVLE